MKIEGIDHVGVAVEDMEQALAMLQNLFGVAPPQVAEDAVGRAKIAFPSIGDSTLELMQSTDPEGAIARFIAQKGPGLHHIALRVKEFDQALEELKAKGVTLLAEPRITPRGRKIAFLNPQSTGGLLVQLVGT